MTAKLLGLDPTSPEMTFLLVMLLTGTMFAVIVYFWKAWRRDYFSSSEAFFQTCKLVIIATAATGVFGIALQKIIERSFYAISPVRRSNRFSAIYGLWPPLWRVWAF